MKGILKEEKGSGGIKKEEGVVIAADPSFSSFASFLVVVDQTVKLEIPMPMYMTMSMNTFFHCLRSVSYAGIKVERFTRLYWLFV